MSSGGEDMITLLSPAWLFMLPLPLAVYFLFPPYQKAIRAIQVPFFERLLATTNQEAQMASVVQQKAKIQTIVLIVCWCTLVLCLAQPARLGNIVQESKTARDLMVAVDLSKSMNTRDFPDGKNKVTRWDALKTLLTTFAEKRQGDRLGLIAFGSGAYVQVPFTDDIQTWQLLLNGLSTDIAGPATAIGDAIGLSIRTFNHSTSPQKVLILVTDGSDTASKLPPIEAAKVAKAKGVTIYTIAIGDPNNQNKDQKVDIKTLDSVSTISHGKSFLAIDSASLQAVLNEINAIAPSQYRTTRYQPVTLLYPHILLFLLCVYFAMGLTLSILEIKNSRSSNA